MDDDAPAQGGQADLQLLLEGERDVDDEAKSARPGSAELQELFLRFKLGGGEKRSGRYRD
jgi:hypothetical protein